MNEPNEFFEQAGVILARAGQYNGISDCIFRTSIIAIAHYDHRLLQNCISLLKRGDRWPDLLDPSHLPEAVKFRSQKSMTRDPYIMTWCAMYLMTEGPTSEISEIRLPWYLRRAYLKNWRKYLVATGNPNSSIRKTVKYLSRFERQLAGLVRWGKLTEPVRIMVEKNQWLKWTRHVFGIHAYSLHLWVWMAYTANSTKAKDLLWQYVPTWNHLLFTLIFDPPTHEPYISEAKNYRSKKGYQWTSFTWKDKDYLPDGQEYYLDKDILNWSLNHMS